MDSTNNGEVDKLSEKLINYVSASILAKCALHFTVLYWLVVVQFCLLQSVLHSSTVLHSRARPATARTRPQLGYGEEEVEVDDDTEEEDDEEEEVTEFASLGGPVTPAATLLRPRLTLTRWYHLILTIV